MSRDYRKYAVAILMVFAILLAFFGSLNIMHKAMADPGWLAGWGERKSHTISSAAYSGTGYQVKLLVHYGSGVNSGQNVYCNGRCKADFGDVRFAGSDGVTLLDYWIEEQVDGDHATFWVEIADDLSSASATIYMYYGNTSATTTSNGDNTFIFYDGFLGTSINTTKWVVRQGDVSVASGELVLTGSSGTRGIIDGTTTFGSNKSIHTKAKFSSTTTHTFHFCSMRQSGTWDNRAGDLHTVNTSPNYVNYVTEKAGVYLPIYAFSLSDVSTYHTYTLGWNLSESKIWQDSTLKQTSNTNIPTVDQCAVFYEGETTSQYCYVDWCFVSKWVDPEPAHGTWVEETNARLYVNPGLTEKTAIDIGTTFPVDIAIEEVWLLYGFDLNLTWDNSLITLNQVSYTLELDAIWGAGQWTATTNSSGTGWYKLVTVSTKNSFNGTTSTPLVKLTFRVEGTNFVKSTSIHFVTHKLGRKDSTAIPHTIADGAYSITGAKPTLAMSSAPAECYILGSEFTIALGISDEYRVNGFEFEVNFATTLLDYVSVTWGASGEGIVSVVEGDGNITGTVGYSTPISGTKTLLSITFKASYYHVWKSLPGWQNVLTGTIFYHKANLTYPSDSPLHYYRSALYEINVGSDVTYMWKPIKGDVDLNGVVEIYDLSVVAGYYDVTPADAAKWALAEPHYELADPNSEQIIDLFDLVVIASNYGASYP